MLKGNSGDLEIVGADILPFPFERAPDLSALCCAGIIEWERRKRRNKHVEFCVFARRIGIRLGAMAQPVDHNRT